MLPERLQGAESPTETLADERAWSFRSLGPGDRAFFVGDAPTEASNGNSQVGIFGDGVCRNPAYRFDGLPAPGTECAGYDRDAIQQIEGALLHVLAGYILKRLPTREPARTVADLHVAGDRADFWVGEM